MERLQEAEGKEISERAIAFSAEWQLPQKATLSLRFPDGQTQSKRQGSLPMQAKQASLLNPESQDRAVYL